jgi:DNA processing protein
MKSITPASPIWPPSLLHIDAPPTKLWLEGRTELLTPGPRIAIVGSRAPTPYGEAQARRFAMAFAQAGITIVSGMARGIDSFAHHAALDAGGKTIAVLGSGVDLPWPNGPLADRMKLEGMLLSEFEPGMPPRRSHFPQRNRLISGLSDAVLVIEAAHASGSLITAHCAADQGRSVYALPGRVDHPMSRGCHRLIKEGAELIESPGMLIEAVCRPSFDFNGSASQAPTSADAPLSATDEESPILMALEGETLSTDELSILLGQDATELMPRLMELEISDRIVRAPGSLWRLGVRGG